MLNNLTPVALFVYNRPDHTIQTLKALQEARLADQTVLYVFADGPKLEADAAERLRIDEVRRIIRSDQWCKEVFVIESTRNKGLKHSIVDGVTEVLNRHGRITVLEDDIIVSVGFLEFCNRALEIYKDDLDVMHISGCMYDGSFDLEEDTCFLKVLSCHGWSTWRRAWEHYNDDVLDHLAYFQSDPKRAQDFDVDGSAYFMKQLRRNVTGELNTWAVRWYASWLRAGGTTLFPKKSLVTNIGFDATGTNCGESRSYLAPAVAAIEGEKMLGPGVQGVNTTGCKHAIC